MSAAAMLRGIPVVPGTAFGPVVVLAAPAVAPAGRLEPEPRGSGDAMAAYDVAAGNVGGRLSGRALAAGGSASAVLTATAGLARDPGLRAAVAARVDDGASLVAAVQDAVGHFADLFLRRGGLTAERAGDLHDLGRRLVAEIVGAPEPGVPTPAEPSVLVAEDLAPADTAGLDPVRVLAIVTRGGGPTSHTAVIARQLGIPCIVAVDGALDLTTGARVLVDATRGSIEVDPDPRAAAERVRDAREQAAVHAAWTGPAQTRDGTRVRLLANVADEASAAEAARAPVEGSGLFRTELCFLNRADEPSVEEQAERYAAVLDAFGAERTVVLRTLDARADKPVPFATQPQARPGLLDRQLDAVALAARRSATRPWVMAPMVATVGAAADFARQVRQRGLAAGVMVEVPGAALLADRLLEHVDFLSVGTNDLARYTMAADRRAGAPAPLTDPWQPAVLALVALAAKAGRRAGRPVGVCGEAAADPLLAIVLVGLGVTSLSMAAAAVRPVGAGLADVSRDACVAAAEAALAARDPAAGREAVRALLRSG